MADIGVSETQPNTFSLKHHSSLTCVAPQLHIHSPVDGDGLGALRHVVGLHDHHPEEPGPDGRVEGDLLAGVQVELLAPHKAGAGVAPVKPGPGDDPVEIRLEERELGDIR